MAKASTESIDELNKALWDACLDGEDITKVKELIKEGAQVSYMKEGKTPLGIAAHLDHGDIVEVLIKANADPDISDVRGRTALWYTSGQGNFSAMKVLTKYGADIESKTKEGESSLHIACRVGKKEIVQHLIRMKANRHGYFNNNTARQIAENENHLDLKMYLLEVVKYEHAVDKALRDETVEVEFTKFSIHGPVGSGKTCLLHLIHNEPLPDTRESTDIHTGATRDVATSTSVAGSSPCSITRVDEDKSLNLLMHQTKPKLQVESEPTDGSSSTGATASNSRDEHDGSRKKESRCKKFLQKFMKKKAPPLAVVDNSETTRDSFVSCGMLSLLPTATDSDASVTVRWIYGTDSGGQPAFQDIAPVFMRHCSLIILTLKLNERLNDYPKFEYMHNGYLVENEGRKQLTNLQMIINLARSLSSVFETECENRSDCSPRLMIVGTFHDQMKSCSESLDHKNEVLKEKLKPFWNKVIVTVPDGNPIHPINTLIKSSEGREECSKDLCRTVLNFPGAIRKVKMPLSHWLFQFEIFMYAESKRKEILRLEECYEIAHSVHINDKGKAIEALKCLDSLGIVFYFSEVLPNLVFVKPQIILKQLSNLISLSFYENLSKVPEYALMAHSFEHFCTDGCFQQSLLETFFPCDSDVFTVEDFVKLMEHLLVLAKAQGDRYDEYFLPCILLWENLTKERIASLMLTADQNVPDPIIFMWEADSSIPFGIFLGTINSLLSAQNDPFRFKLFTNGTFRNQRNAVFLKCERTGVCLLLVDRVGHIELHFKGDTQHCPKVLYTVERCICETAWRFHYFYEYKNVKNYFMSSCEPDKCDEHPIKVIYSSNNFQLKGVCGVHNSTVDLTRSQSVWYTSGIQLEISLRLSSLPQNKTLDLPSIFNALKPISYDWERLGACLKIPDYEIKTTSKKYNDNVVDCFTDIIDKWMKSYPDDCTAECLYSALNEMEVDF